jgi:hypothetical protein
VRLFVFFTTIWTFQSPVEGQKDWEIPNWTLNKIGNKNETRRRETEQKRKKRVDACGMLWCIVESIINVFSFFCVWITLGVYSVKNRPKEKKERMRWGVLCFILVWNFFSLNFLFSLLVSGPSREGCQFTCLSLRRVALLWSCHITCWVEPADNLKPGTRGPWVLTGILLSLSLFLSVVLCYG